MPFPGLSRSGNLNILIPGLSRVCTNPVDVMQHMNVKTLLLDDNSYMPINRLVSCLEARLHLKISHNTSECMAASLSSHSFIKEGQNTNAYSLAGLPF